MLQRFLLFIPLFSFNYCAAQDLYATQMLSDYLTPEHDYVIETTIHKIPAVSSVKFVQNIPKGFVAKRFNSMRGEFCFQDNTVMVEWDKVPRASTFTFSYALSIPKDTTGNISMNGNVFFVVDSANRNFDIQYKIIKIENVLATQRDTLKTMPIDTLPLEASLNNKFFRIQFGVFRFKKDHFGDVPGLLGIPYEKGMIKYYSGNYTSLEEAYKHLPEIVAQGYKDAFVVEFEDGKVIKQLLMSN